MSFVCPECLTANALRISESITLPPDSRSDDILLQIIKCTQCRFQGAAIYEESRRGGFDSESWTHEGFRLSAKELKQLAALINRCPNKKNKNCQCSSHKTLKRTNEFGRWQMPDVIDPQHAFPLRRG